MFLKERKEMTSDRQPLFMLGVTNRMSARLQARLWIIYHPVFALLPCGGTAESVHHGKST